VITWLAIAGAEPVVLIADVRARQWIASSLRVAEVLRAVDPLRDSIEGEVANVSVTCDNEHGQCKGLFAVPPLGMPATLYGARSGAAVALFEGVVESVSLEGEDCRLGLIA